MAQPLRILFVSPEAVPFAKTGGLADVAGALPLALQRLGLKVALLMPLYAQVRQSQLELHRLDQDLQVGFDFFTLNFDLYHRQVEGVDFYFVERDEFFDRRYLYGTPKGDYFDNLERYLFLTKTLLPVCQTLDLRPDIIHCHDWQAALIPIYLQDHWRREEIFAGTATVLTIHNLAYQGLFPKEKFHLLELPPERFGIEGLEFYDRINFLKAGILFADAVTTVSRQYSREIQTEEFGCGLDGVLRTRAAVLTGIVNGVDYRVWDPATDPLLAANYDADHLQGKTANKQALIQEFGLDPGLAAAPLLGMVTRLADQKGLDLLAAILPELMTLELTLVILGTGDQKYHDLLSAAAQTYRGRLGVKIAFDNRLAHLIEAGADMFLMPSYYEPCGLNQIYSLKYGTIPVVRAVGGLVDTIEPLDLKKQTGTGFRFQDYSPQAFLACIREALAAFQNKKLWQQLMRRAMSQDFSWDASAKAYIELYQQTLARKTGTKE